MSKEIAKEILHKHFSRKGLTIEEAEIAAMQEYAALQAKPLVEALEEWQKLDLRIHTAIDAGRCHLKARQVLNDYNALSSIEGEGKKEGADNE